MIALRAPAAAVLAFALVACAAPQKRLDAARDAAPPPAPPARPAAEAPAAPAGPDRSQLPPPAPLRPFAAPVPREVRLANGLRVLLLERHDVPLFTAQIVVRGGSGADPAKLPGLASFTAAMMDEGTRTYDAAGLAEAADGLGASLWTGADFETMSVGVSGLVENLAPTLALLAEVALRPTFPEKDLERVRAERLAALLAEADQPATVAGHTVRRLLWGDHPMGRRASGTKASIAAIRRSDLVETWQARFVPENAALMVAGDVTAETLLPALQAALGGWKGKAAPPLAPAPPRAPQTPALVMVDRPGAPQSVITIAVPGYSAADPDRAAAEVLNAILGGMFSSRINLNLREDKGYTYGAGSYAAPLSAAGTLYLQAAVKAEHTADSLAELLREMRRLVEAPPSAAELELARAYLVRVQPLRFETAGGVAGQFAGLWAVGLPLDWHQSYAARIEAVTAEDIHRVARRLLSAPPAIAVVGDRAAHAPALTKLGVAPLAFWDADQAPVN